MVSSDLAMKPRYALFENYIKSVLYIDWTTLACVNLHFLSSRIIFTIAVNLVKSGTKIHKSTKSICQRPLKRRCSQSSEWAARCKHKFSAQKCKTDHST